jgi:hypothetical protein
MSILIRRLVLLGLMFGLIIMLLVFPSLVGNKVFTDAEIEEVQKRILVE